MFGIKPQASYTWPKASFTVACGNATGGELPFAESHVSP
jgi:hypothetical protein